MNYNDWLSAFQHSNEVLKQLDGITETLSKFSEYVPYAKIQGFEKKLFSAVDFAFEQYTQTNNLFKEISFDAKINALNSIGNIISSSYFAASKIVTTPELFEEIVKIDKVTYDAIPGAVSAIDQIGKALKLYQVPGIDSSINNILSQLSVLDPSLFEAAKHFDLSEVEIDNEGDILYEGLKYSHEEIPNILDSQMGIVKKVTLKDRFEELCKRFWLLLIVLRLIMFLPQLPETVEFYRDTVMEIQYILEEKSHICFTIKERSILREEARSNSPYIIYLPYDTPLEIIDTIPRWYQVKYTDENGVEIIGWISKISVEMEG